MTDINETGSITFMISSTCQEPVLTITQDGDVYYRFNGEMKKVEQRDDILEAFRYCVLGQYGEEPDKALFNKFLDRIDNGELTDEQLKQLEKRIRKTKLNKLNYD